MLKQKLSLSVIVPTFNERKNINPLIKEIKQVLANTTYEIIVVDDNSPDKTGKEIAKTFKKDKSVKVLVREKEKGLGTAILHGIKNSKYPVVVGMDADFNHPPKLLPKMVGELGDADFVVASRFLQNGGMEEKRRHLPTLVFNKLLKNILGFPISDNTSGFYAVKRKKLLQLPIEKIYKGYGEYHLRLVYLASRNNFRIKEVPVFYKKRKYGKSKSNLPKMFFVYIAEALRLRLLYGKEI